jgi:hypothetical protein
MRIEHGTGSATVCGVYLVYHMNPSPEIKKLIEKLGPKKGALTSQDKYEAILKRKSYDHHCFLECVRLRLDPSRGMETTQCVQTASSDLFTQMLSHTL